LPSEEVTPPVTKMYLVCTTQRGLKAREAGGDYATEL